MLPLPILILYTLAFNVGMGSPTWVVATEILPVRSRRWTHTVANVTSNLCWFVVTKTYKDISTQFGLYVPFFIYGSICLFGLVFIYVFLPETRGRTPEETAKAFRCVSNLTCLNLGALNRNNHNSNRVWYFTLSYPKFHPTFQGLGTSNAQRTSLQTGVQQQMVLSLSYRCHNGAIGKRWQWQRRFVSCCWSGQYTADDQ